MAQQLRNATMDSDMPAVLLRDRDDEFGPAFNRSVASTAVEAEARHRAQRDEGGNGYAALPR